ncbi:MAB_1171c family putative transporter [Amycolatopsis aidingensis]|uniref:MAB_1171c family putative transporter n=1 Tax=Amycolatopsis aidingensis TaxID=2842453 RepID=UPI001C0B9BB7|nr:MAB_1171c family putative transporter [Amycolatopsis aidingensis]
MFAWVEIAGFTCLWLVAVLRAPQAIRHPQQRALWLAVTLIAFTTTLHQPPVVAGLGGLIGDPTLVVVIKHTCDVIASSAMLHFILTAMGWRRHLPFLLAAAITAGTALSWINLAHAPPGYAATPELDLPASYWVIFFGFHFVSNSCVVAVCLRYWRQADRWPMRWGLLTFGIGTLFACVLWLLFPAYLWTRIPALLPAASLVTGIEEILQAAGVALPAVPGIRRAFTSRRNLWTLWPLWRHVTSWNPQVALVIPRFRLVNVLLRTHLVDLHLYRAVIEIRDAILILSEYITPALIDRARAHVRAHQLPPAEANATVTACLISVATQASGQGEFPRQTDLQAATMGGEDLSGEIDFLRQVIKARKSPVVKAFARENTLTPWTADRQEQPQAVDGP